MNTTHLLPLIIIGVAVQIFVQICCIKNCLKNIQFTRRAKIIWLFIIVLFNILGVIIYLVVTRKKSLNYSAIAWEIVLIII